MCFIGVCVVECVNEPLCDQALVRRPEEKEPSYLCSLPALPHTLSVAEEKAHSAGPAWGGRALFTLGLWETSPYCACHLHMTHSFPKGPCEGGIRGTFAEFIKPFSHAASGPKGPVLEHYDTFFLQIYLMSTSCSLSLILTLLHPHGISVPCILKCRCLLSPCAVFNVRVKA